MGSRAMPDAVGLFFMLIPDPNVAAVTRCKARDNALAHRWMELPPSTPRQRCSITSAGPPDKSPLNMPYVRWKPEMACSTADSWSPEMP